ncbi:MAG: hypothetical protein ACT4UQ_09295 [Gammaproteobacteria bacterium]
MGLALILLVVAAIAAAILREWGFLSIGGALMASQGAVLTASRLFRLGLSRADDPAPPITGAQGRVQIDAFFEHGQRAEDHFKVAIGIWLIVIGTSISGAAVFVLNYVAPW